MFNKLFMDLQLFSDEEDIEELEQGGYQGDDEEEYEDEEYEDEEDLSEDETDDDLDEDEDLDEDPEDNNPSLDKKTKSIIKHRREKKELRRQLQDAQEKLQEIELEKETNSRIQELTKQGLSSTEAAKKAEGEFEVTRLRNTIARMELEKLEDKHPGISNYAQQLAASKAKMPEFSYEQLYLANHSKLTEFDKRTKLEQEILHKNKQGRSRSLEDGAVKQTRSTKLSAADERTYRFLAKSRPGLTRKAYQELLSGSEMDT